jgi:hypothetical protein
MDSISMNSLARVSAVFLLVGLVWVSGVMGGEGNRRGYSEAQAQSKQTTGVGTRVGLQQGDSGVREESPAPGEPSEAKGASGGGGDALTVFREVEAGWRSATPKPFEKYLRKGKVRLDFGEGGPRGGLFARSQAYYLIADYLKGTQTLQIGFAKISDGSRGSTKPYALLERVFRDKNGISRKEVVFVSLALEDSSWTICELRAIPAK